MVKTKKTVSFADTALTSNEKNMPQNAKIPNKHEREILRQRTEARWKDAFWGLEDFHFLEEERESNLWALVRRT